MITDELLVLIRAGLSAGATKQVLQNPQHSYTAQLLDAVANPFAAPAGVGRQHPVHRQEQIMISSLRRTRPRYWLVIAAAVIVAALVPLQQARAGGTAQAAVRWAATPG